MSVFNWKPSEKQPTTEERLEKYVELTARRLNDLEVKWERDRADLWKAIKDTQEAVSKPQTPPDLTALESRMAVFDTWRAQLHTLLIERGNTGKEKLSRTGNALSKFYGKK